MTRGTDRPRLALGRCNLALVTLQASLALVGLGFDLARACGSCSRVTELHAFIAGAGIFGYLLLFGLKVAGCQRLFTVGVFMAAGVHLALVGWMAERSSFCPPCIVSATIALGLLTLSLYEDRSRAALLGRALLPTFLAAAAFAVAAERTEQLRLKDQKRTIARLRNTPREPRPADGRASLVVYEMEHCTYCQEFRELFLPRLRNDFGRRLEVRFLPAGATNWVRRTPTFVMNGDLVFEGLPLQYEDLRKAVLAGVGAP